MIRSQSDQIDAVRIYDGNGREIKRSTAHLIETQNSTYWELQPIKYYIRSSVLRNEVVSEVWANGKKGKTFVRAAGSQLAYQSAYASDTANLNEAVLFEYTDASGMSQRTTDKTGAAGKILMVKFNSNRRMIHHLDSEGRAAHQDQYTYYSYQYN